MHYLQPLAEFMSHYWWVWLFCTIAMFVVRVKLVPKKDDDESVRRDGRFLRIAVELAMWTFGVFLAASLVAIVGYQFDLW